MTPNDLSALGLALGLSGHWLQALGDVFETWAPEFDVWAYGSRVSGQHHAGSDLDLVLIHPTEPESMRCLHGVEIRQALSDSSIPICVDVLDWASIPETFQTQINKQKIRLFEAKPSI